MFFTHFSGDYCKPPRLCPFLGTPHPVHLLDILGTSRGAEILPEIGPEGGTRGGIPEGGRSPCGERSPEKARCPQRPRRGRRIARRAGGA